MRRCLTYTVREVAPYINWLYYFHAWDMEPRFSTVVNIHDCPSCRASWIASFPIAEQPKAQEAMRLYDEAMALLRTWADESMCHALFLLADAHSEGDDIIIDNKTRIPLLRQQHESASGYTLCLSDFIRGGDAPYLIGRERKEDTSNTIGIFASTVSLPEGYQSSTLSLQHSTLADRLAEATAEKMHEEVRKHYWGYAREEHLTMSELHDEKFQGIRPAVGYPSLPDQSINFIIDHLLHLSDIGITLSENGAMSPHCSVTGLMIAHPQARYFSVGNIGEDQLTDYAHRRKMSKEKLRKFLSNLQTLFF